MTSAIAYAEVAHGSARGRAPAYDQLQAFVEEVPVLDFDYKAALAYAALPFRRGSYGNLNVLYYPWKNVLTGLEFVWGELEQKDGQSATDYRLQFSTKVTF